MTDRTYRVSRESASSGESTERKYNIQNNTNAKSGRCVFGQLPLLVDGL